MDISRLNTGLVLGILVFALAGCGYRAPMYKTVVREDPARFTEVEEAYRPLTALICSDTGMPPTTGNALSILPDSPQKFDLLLEDLRSAEESVYLDFYRICPDTIGTRVTDILKDKAAAGMDVRMVVDKGALTKADRQALLALQDDSIRVFLYYKPLWLQDHVWPAKGMHRDHRKIALIDGRTAHTGGRNIQDKYLDWRDADIRIAGPAIADLGRVVQLNQQIQRPEPPALKIPQEPAFFAVDDSTASRYTYRDKTVQVIPDDPRDKLLPTRNCFEWAIMHAQRYFYFYNPYTPPPASMIRALKEAAMRGVDVRWIVPANNDVKPAKWVGESLYKPFLKAGLRIFEWQGNVMHAKEFISDDYLLAIGSANMDNLSFFLDQEVEVLIYDKEVASDARDLFLEDQQNRCQEIKLEEIRRWNVFRKLRNVLARFFFGAIT